MKDYSANRKTNINMLRDDSRFMYAEHQYKPKKISLSGDAVKYIFHHDNDIQDGEMTVYTVFPGIKLIYHSVHTDCCCLGMEQKGHLFEIQYCQEGCIEQQYKDAFFYLMPGDLSIFERTASSNKYYFPIHHYHGISIIMDADIAPKCFSCFLEDVDVGPLQVAKKLCADKECFVIHSQNYIEHMFSELYAIPKNCQKGFLKIKIMELFLVLNNIHPNENNLNQLTFSKSQVILAKNIAAYLTDKMDKHVTVAELSDKFHISQTYLQNVFKGVYGVPVYSYIRIQKMQAAALQLIHTELTVLAIANGCGYDNASKFSSAFREIMGESPCEYRKKHRILYEEKII